MTWKEFITDYLTFSRKDRMGVVVLLLLLGLIFILRNFMGGRHSSSLSNEELSWLDSPKGRKFLDSIKMHYANLQQRSSPYRVRDESRYSKAGPSADKHRYYKQYSFHRYKTTRTGDGAVNNAQSKIRAGPTVVQNAFRRLTLEGIDVNDADTAMLIALPGIGSKLAGRILKFREKLGGFYSIEQIGETFGLPDSTFQKIRKYLALRNLALRKININTAGEEELKSHPYIRWAISGPIITYRNEHGPFEKLEDLKNVMAVTEEVYGKILPYLAVE